MLKAPLFPPMPALFIIPFLPLHIANGGGVHFNTARHHRNVSANYTSMNIELETIPLFFWFAAILARGSSQSQLEIPARDFPGIRKESRLLR
jgi:hypothetical protein